MVNVYLGLSLHLFLENFGISKHFNNNNVYISLLLLHILTMVTSSFSKTICNERCVTTKC